MMTPTEIIELAQDAGAEWSDFGRIQFESEDDLVNFFDRALKTKQWTRQWVDLTDDEIEEIYAKTNAYDAVKVAAAKLKEKNT